jgi:hypothetical protein
VPSAALQLERRRSNTGGRFDRFYRLMAVAGRLQANPAIEPPFTKT